MEWKGFKLSTQLNKSLQAYSEKKCNEAHGKGNKILHGIRVKLKFGVILRVIRGKSQLVSDFQFNQLV